MVVILYIDVGFQGSSPTYEQAHVGLDLLTLVSCMKLTTFNISK